MLEHVMGIPFDMHIKWNIFYDLANVTLTYLWPLACFHMGSKQRVMNAIYGPPMGLIKIMGVIYGCGHIMVGCHSMWQNENPTHKRM